MNPVVPIDKRSKPVKFHIRKKIYNRDGGRCLRCKSPVLLFSRYRGDPFTGEVDHIQPRSRGGCGAENNLQLLCAICNRRKYNKEEQGNYVR